jgi:hypothetical protein
MRSKSRAVLVAFAATLLACVLPQVATAVQSGAAGSAHHLGYSLTPSTTEPYTPCPPGSGHVECNLIIDPNPVHTASGYALPSGGPLLEGGGEKGGFDPKDLQSAYKIPTSGGSGQTVAVVDAYGDSTAESDLAKYREKYGLTSCKKETGCFKKVNEKGEEANYPAAGPELWGAETALDIEMVSAACPECHILLIEASGEYPAETATSVEEAAKLGATEISNSYGYPEDDETVCPSKKGCSEYLAAYDHAGIPVTASAGDSGYNDGVGAPNWPATSPNVIAVGGTEIKKAENARGWSETVWADSGGGCSLYESKPAWQHDPGCTKRTDNDVAAVAAGVSIYSTPYVGGWGNVGGTSVAAPLVAGIEAHASSTVKKEGAEAFYRHTLFDVTSGANGDCHHTYLCEAEEGYDGPTGWGTPDGPLELTPKTAAVTDAATGVTATEATLNGYVYTTALSTTYRFEYGPTTSYGTDAPVPNGSVGTEATWQSVSQAIGHLHALQGTYHYRLVATNSSGTVYGADHTFTTIPWTVQLPSSPSGAKGATLQAISCSSTTCTAVSSYRIEAASETVPLIEGWNGTEWGTPQPAPKPAGSKYATTDGVSCASSSACTAVGSYTNSAEVELPLAEMWSGKEWAVQTPPAPTGAIHVGLAGISCLTATECIAVGSYEPNPPDSPAPLAELWNGKEWSLQKPPAPGGAEYASLRGVSCVSSTLCIAVGSYATVSTSAEKPFAELWNGKEWSVQSTPDPSEAQTAELLGVACSSSTACTAVGRSTSTSKVLSGLAEQWNGKEWSLDTTPDLIEESLSGVSCVSSSQCIAVGGSDRSPLSERWNGSGWSVEGAGLPEEVPAGFENAQLAGVSCLSSNVCAAVGWHIGLSEGGLGYDTPLAERRPSPKPYTETREATAIGETGATLQGIVDPEDSETKYYFEYGTTEAYGSKTAEASAGSGENNVEEGKALTGLTLGTPYDYRIVATNGAGTTYGKNEIVTPSGKPSVETKAATGVTTTEATLHATVNPKGSATKYYFEYYEGKGAWIKTAEASAGSGIANVEEKTVLSGLEGEESFHFRIVASNSNGTSTGSTLAFETLGVEFSANALKAPASKFTTTGGSVKFETTSGTNYGCSTSSGKGEFLTAKTATITLTFKGCSDNGFKCTSEGAEAGTIATASLPVELVYLSKEKHEAGLVVNYHGTSLAKWRCEGGVSSAGIDESIVVPITPVNTSTKSFTIDFAGKSGIQQPSWYESAEGTKITDYPTMSLLGDGYQEGSLTDAMTLATLEKIEVKA